MLKNNFETHLEKAQSIC